MNAGQASTSAPPPPPPIAPAELKAPEAASKDDCEKLYRELGAMSAKIISYQNQRRMAGRVNELKQELTKYIETFEKLNCDVLLMKNIEGYKSVVEKHDG